MRLIDRLDTLLHSKDRVHVQQGIELLLSLDEPAILAHYARGTTIDAHGVVHIGAPIRRFAPYLHDEAIAVRLLAMQEGLDSVESLALSDALYMLPDLLPGLPNLKTLRCTDTTPPIRDALLNALPPNLSVLDLTGVEEMRRAEVARLLDRLPPDCAVAVSEVVFHDAVVPDPGRVLLRPWPLCVLWEGSGEDSETVTLTFTRDGRFVRTHTEDTNYGMCGDRYRGTYTLDRQAMQVTLRLDGYQSFTTVRCPLADCPAQPRWSFGGGHTCDRKPCKNLGEGWTDPQPTDGTETLVATYNANMGALRLTGASFSCFWQVTGWEI